jgi:hypothetical protein
VTSTEEIGASFKFAVRGASLFLSAEQMLRAVAVKTNSPRQRILYWRNSEECNARDATLDSYSKSDVLFSL